MNKRSAQPVAVLIPREENGAAAMRALHILSLAEAMAPGIVTAVLPPPKLSASGMFLQSDLDEGKRQSDRAEVKRLRRQERNLRLQERRQA